MGQAGGCRCVRGWRQRVDLDDRGHAGQLSEPWKANRNPLESKA